MILFSEYLLVRADRSSSNHGSEAESETTNTNNPRVGNHNSVNEASLNHLSSRQSNDTNSETSVQEGVVQVFALVDGHAAVLTSLPVEDSIDGDKGTTKDGTSNQKSSAGRLRRCHDGSLLVVRATTCSLEGIAGGGSDARREEVG